MNFGRNSLVHILKQNNVGGIVALPSTYCLRAVYVAAYSAAHVERTGKARRRFLDGPSAVRQTGRICRICPGERLQ
jgi:hypothetical protein